MLALVVAGTRPEVIKLSPVLRAFESRGIEYTFAATGQHYDLKLFGNFVEELGLPQPEYNLEVGSGSHAFQTARVLEGLEQVISDVKPSLVLAQGDTNAVLSSALSSAKLHTAFAHVEAGLRSFDFTMPEEVNRVIADRLATMLFAPTERSGLNLLREGIGRNRIHITGNTVVDATLLHVRLAEQRSGAELPEGYCLLTLHRAENVDSVRRLKAIIGALEELGEKIVFPAHPRTLERLSGFGMLEKLPENITLLEPMGYLDFIYALNHSQAVLTDSGGVQEEALTLRKPCITLRTSTERQETLIAEGNILAGVSKEDVLSSTGKALSGELEVSRKNPLGDGRAGERIAGILERLEAGGKLSILSPEEKVGEESRKLIEVGEELVGKRLSQLDIEVQRVFQEGEEIFPRRELMLERSMLLEVIERRFY